MAHNNITLNTAVVGLLQCLHLWLDFANFFGQLW